MTYNEIQKRITPILKDNGFRVIARSKNSTRFESEFVSFHAGFDERENCLLFFVGIKNRFHSDLVYAYEFFNENFHAVKDCDAATKLIYFLTGKGKAILQGDVHKLEELEKFTNEKAKRYTKKLLNGQNLNAAENAWQIKNYHDFIKNTEQIEDENLSKSYILKKEYALKKLSKY
jgi:hypothetical protein